MIHHVFANRSNVGDWLSAIGIQMLLGSEPVIEHLCDDPFVEQTLHELATLGPGDVVIFGGGGLFMDYFEPLWAGMVDLIGSFPYCIWGAGYCDMKREHSRPDEVAVRKVIAGADLCVVRDELTRVHIGMDTLPAPIPCPSVAALAEIHRTGPDVLHVANYDTVGAPAYEFMRAYGMKWADAHGLTFRETNNRIEAGRTADLDHVLSLYTRSKLVVASALHGCIIGVAAGCKVVAVSGDHKIESFMQAAGLDQWVIDASDVEDLPSLIESAEEQPSVDEFVHNTIARNLGVAGKVRELIAR